MQSRFKEIQIGDLVEGTSMHNNGLTGYVLDFDPNAKAEYLVHWFVSREHVPNGFYHSQERFYDLKKIS
jgi:hypothetical protein